MALPRTEFGHWSLSLLGGYAIFLGAIQVFTLGLSLGKTQISHAVAAAVLGVALLCGASVGGWLHGSMAQPRRGARNGPSPPRVVIGVMIWSAIVWSLLWAAAYLQRDLSYDGNWYHIPTIHEWALKGYVHWIKEPFMGVSVMNGYPKGAELVGYIFVTAFDDSHLVNTINLLFLPLGMLGIVYLSHLLGASAQMALLAGSSFALIPVNIGQAVTTYVDTAFACCVIAFFATLVVLFCLMVAGNRIGIPLVASLGATMGLAMGTKGTGVPMVLIGLSVFSLMSWLKVRTRSPHHRRAWARWHGRSLVFALIVALSICAYWYLRNWIAAGDPFYPVGVTVGGHRLFAGQPLEEVLDVDNTPRFMRLWPDAERILCTWTQGLSLGPGSMHGYNGYGCDNRLGGLGFLWLGFCLPVTLLLVLWEQRGNVNSSSQKPLLLLVTLVSVSFLATPMNWWARYTVWIYGLGLPCLAAVFTKALSVSRRPGVWRLYAWACATVLLVESGLCLHRLYMMTRASSQRPARGTSLAIFNRQTWEWPVCEDFRGTLGTPFEGLLSSDASVAVGPLNDDKAIFIGNLCMPIGRRQIVVIPLDLDNRDMKRLVDRNIPYVVWDDHLTLSPALRTSATEIAHVAGLRLLKMRPRAPSTRGVT